MTGGDAGAIEVVGGGASGGAGGGDEGTGGAGVVCVDGALSCVLSFCALSVRMLLSS